jgi:hypothetical protein
MVVVVLVNGVKMKWSNHDARETLFAPFLASTLVIVRQ